MRVNLKKANSLEAAAKLAASKIKIENSISLPIYGNADLQARIDAQVAQAETMLGEVRDLVRAAYAIRSLIGVANARCGISQLLSDRSVLDGLEARLGLFAPTLEDMSPVPNVHELFERIEAAKARATTGQRIMLEESITVRVLPPALGVALREELAVLRREKSDNKDRCAALNITNEIEIPDEVAAVLRAHKIVE